MNLFLSFPQRFSFIVESYVTVETNNRTLICKCLVQMSICLQVGNMATKSCMVYQNSMVLRNQEKLEFKYTSRPQIYAHEGTV